MNRIPVLLSTAVLLTPVSLLSVDAIAQGQDGGRRPGGFDRPERPGGAERPRRGQGQGGRNQGQDPLRGRMQAGSSIPGFAELVAYNPDGSKTLVAELVPEDGKLVVVTGCLTCPKFLNSYRDIEAVAHDYRSAGKNVSFVYLYKSLAHPENGRWIQPFTLEERLGQVTAAQKQLENKVPFICDGMDNSVSTALGGSPNSAFVLDSNGKMLFVSGWAEGKSVRDALVKHVGPTEHTSTPEEIGVPRFTRPYRSTGQTVPRVEVPGTMHGLVTEPGKSKEPYYVKLRAEVEPSVTQGQPGKMYIGFHLDPVHGVHWNNLVDPVSWSMTAPEGVEITPSSGAGPRVEAQTDSDPREFLVDVVAWEKGKPIEFTVRYFACSEKEGWCKPVEQTYVVLPERDRFAGMASNRWNRGGERGRERGGARGGGGAGGAEEMLARMDRNGDGKIAQSEVMGPMADRFEMFDLDGDGYIADSELEKLRERMQQRQRSGQRGGQRGGNRGGQRGGNRGGNDI